MLVNILMHHLQVEEIARNKDKKFKPSKKGHVVEAKPKGHFTSNKREFKKFAKGNKKLVERPKNRLYCYVCEKPRHLDKA